MLQQATLLSLLSQTVYLAREVGPVPDTRKRKRRSLAPGKSCVEEEGHAKLDQRHEQTPQTSHA